MNGIIPDKFNIDGNLTIKWDKEALTESVTLIAMVVIIIIVVSLLAYQYIKKL